MSSALIVTFLFFVSCLFYSLVPWLSCRVLRGQVFEGVSQNSMGWMLSNVCTALESYGLVARAAKNPQAENTQIQGIYNAEQANAKKGLEASNLSTEARHVSYETEKGANQLNYEGRIEAAGINQTDAMEAAHLKMMSTVVACFFRDMDRRVEELKPKY